MDLYTSVIGRNKMTKTPNQPTNQKRTNKSGVNRIIHFGCFFGSALAEGPLKKEAFRQFKLYWILLLVKQTIF